jgi:adenylosuccinate synthase
MPYHKMQDGVMESLGEGAGTAIGTTRRGIGPAYADKVSRTTAIRTGDLLRPEHLREKLRLVCPVRSAQIRGLGGDPGTLDPDELTEEYTALGHRLADFMTDTTYLLHDAVAAGRSILFEGANACLLDVDHGTYPYVTSSSATTLGIPSGTGLPAWNLHRVIGVMKAYATRVGAGPFPTELGDETGDRIRERGREYGTTTGRPRRCGWLDLVAVRYSAMICGVRSLAVMLLDVLSGLEEVEPIYETLEGWEEMIEDTTDRAALPARAQAYLSRIEDLAQVPVEIVSVGPERSQTLACAS